MESVKVSQLLKLLVAIAELFKRPRRHLCYFFLNHWLFFQTSMNVKLEHTTATDMLYVPTRQEASNVAAAPGGSEMALSALVGWKTAAIASHELPGL